MRPEMCMTATDREHELVDAESELGVTVEGQSGPRFQPMSWQTHSLEGRIELRRS